jgi:adenine deaminase
MISIKPWQDVAPLLIDVAAGRRPAELVIRNGRWVNVYSGEIIAHTDLAIISGRFAYVGPDASRTIDGATKIIDAHGRYLVPGLCDGHMHVESGMLTATEFARAVIPHGTTSMFIDPHEIANVLGLPGVKLMHDEAMVLPINVWLQMPSCVPSAPGLEHAGASISADHVAEAMKWPLIIGLGEMMNYPGVIAKDTLMLTEIAVTQAAGKNVGGHYASRDLGRPFHAYAAGGPADDHEGTVTEDAVARVRQGMRAMLRLGSAWYDVASQVKAITEMGVESRNFILCTDDSHALTLIEDGHMDRVVRHAITQGVRPLTAIQMASLNTAQHFGVEREIGSIASGRRADLIISSDLSTLPIEVVAARGVVLAEDGRIAAELPTYRYPLSARNSVRIDKILRKEDFDIVAPIGAQKVRARVIGIIENQAPTKALERELAVKQGLVVMDRDRDICQVAVIERHRGTGSVCNGFVSGFGYNIDCAVASTVAHDSHHMIVVGTSKADMAQAANRLRSIGGGIVVYAAGKEIALIELVIAGLISEERAEIVATKIANLLAAMRHCGCALNNAYMQHSLLALVVIPELRISDIGLVDVARFAKTELFVEPSD